MISLPKRFLFYVLPLAIYALCEMAPAQAQYIRLDDDLAILPILDLRPTEQLKLDERKNKDRIKQFKSDLTALRELSRVAVAREDWGALKNWSKRVLKIRPNDIEAKYLLGVAFRESGKFKALFLRQRDFNKARDYFAQVIGQDSTFRNVLLQRGWLERYDRNWTAAIHWARRQAQVKPELPEAYLGLMSLYRLYLIHSGETETSAWLASENDVWARVAEAELHRRHKRFAQADSVSRTLLDQAPRYTRIPVRLLRVRLHVEQKDYRAANDEYWRALDQAASHADVAFLFDDAKYLFSDDELLQLSQLRSVAEKKTFLRRFWRRRELAPASPVQFRLVEHYRRLVIAERDYWYDGVRSAVSNPDRLGYLHFPRAYRLNHEFNDKGLVFIRHGAPDDRAVTLGELLNSNESWLYYDRQDRHKMIFHFLISSTSTGNNWRLTPSLENRNMLADRIGWDHSITRVYQSKSAGEFQGNLVRMAQQSRETVEYAMSSDFHTWQKDIRALDMPYHLASFRGKENKTELHLVWAVPTTQIEMAEDTGKRAPDLEFGTAILDSLYETVALVQDSVLIESTDSNIRRSHYLRHFTFELAPAEYELSFYARQELEKQTRMGGERFNYSLRSYDTAELDLSDLLPAFDVRVTTTREFRNQQLGVSPNPTMSFSTTQPVFLYYEIYNLQQDANGKTDYEIENELVSKKGKGGLGKVFGFLGGGGKKRISITERRHGASRDAVEYMSFDVSSLSKGDYELRVKVTDHLASRSVERSVALRLTRE